MEPKFNSNWIAKTSPTVKLSTHSTKVKEAAREIINTQGNRNFINNNLDFNPDEVIEAAELSALLHDFGKAHPDWQKWAHDPENQKKPTHSDRSAMVAMEFLKEHKREKGIEFIFPIVIAVLHHHTNLSKRNWNLENVSEGTVKLQEFTDSLREAGMDISITRETIKYLRRMQNNIKSKQISDDEYIKYGLFTTLIRSVLIQADHIVSSDGEKNYPQRLSCEDFSLFNELRSFQKKTNENSSKDELIGLAGCGEGKTHAALQWGEQKIKQGHADGLVFAMPTQTTTNNMYLNLTKEKETISAPHISEEKCELHHSQNQVFYETTAKNKEDTNEENEGTITSILSERERKLYSAGVTVSTVDHILNTLVNNQKASSIAKGNLFNKAIIFDELHTYDTKTLSNIISAIRVLHEWNIPYFIITATLPPYIEEKISTNNKIKSDGTFSSGKTRKPYTVTRTKTELTPETIKKYKRNPDINTVMVVKNTVREAQKFAFQHESDPEINVTYYSSEFTPTDRKQKETEIRNKYTPTYKQPENTKLDLLVATQVCEISLDISVDKIHTDIAPIESLLQRMGRLHRKGETHTSKNCNCPQCERKTDHTYNCTIHLNKNGLETGEIYPYSSSKKDWAFKIIEKTFKFFEKEKTYSFPNSVKWLDSVYNSIKPPTINTTKYYVTAKKDLIYGKPRWDNNRYPIREIHNNKREVLPTIYIDKNTTIEDKWEQTHFSEQHTKSDCELPTSGWNSCKAKLYRFVSQNSVPMPRYWINNKTNPTNFTITVRDTKISVSGITKVDLNYSYKWGLLPPELGKKLHNNLY